MSGLYTRRRRKAEINIVPLIDVLTMLIFFFLVTMQFRQMSTLNLTLPKMETAGKNLIDQHVEIAITKDGKYSVQIADNDGRVVYKGSNISEDQIDEVASQLKQVDKDITILIRSDQDTPLRLVTEAMDICRKNGLNKIRLQTRGAE